MKTKTLSLVLMLGYPPLNIGAILAIVRVDNWFLLSPAYVIVFGVLAPLLLLTPLWALAIRARTNGKALILPALATAVTIMCGGIAFLHSSHSKRLGMITDQ